MEHLVDYEDLEAYMDLAKIKSHPPSEVLAKCTRNGTTVLHMLSERGQVKSLRWLLKRASRASVNRLSYSDLSVVYSACISNPDDVAEGIVKMLACKGACLEVPWQDGSVAVYFAFSKGLVKTGKFLLSTRQEDTAIRFNGCTLLNALALNHDTDTFDWVLRHRKFLKSEKEPDCASALRNATISERNVVWSACYAKPLDEKTCMWIEGRLASGITDALSKAIRDPKEVCLSNKLHLLGMAGRGKLLSEQEILDYAKVVFYGYASTFSEPSELLLLDEVTGGRLRQHLSQEEPRLSWAQLTLGWFKATKEGMKDFFLMHFNAEERLAYVRKLLPCDWKEERSGAWNAKIFEVQPNPTAGEGDEETFRVLTTLLSDVVMINNTCVLYAIFSNPSIHSRLSGAQLIHLLGKIESLVEMHKPRENLLAIYLSFATWVATVDPSMVKRRVLCGTMDRQNEFPLHTCVVAEKLNVDREIILKYMTRGRTFEHAFSAMSAFRCTLGDMLRHLYASMAYSHASERRLKLITRDYVVSWMVAERNRRVGKITRSRLPIRACRMIMHYLTV